MSKRKIESPEQMEQLWEKYKEYCDNYQVTQTEFSGKESRFVSGTVKKSITYTIEGFCVYIGLARSKFYATYLEDKDYEDIVTRMRDESEADCRKKFETGCIPTQLSGLWMSKFGYATKQQTDVNASMSDADRALLERVAKRLDGDKS